jgi:large subunit ribosomal protein L3
MTPALLGKKVGMTRIYDETGAIVPVTVVQAGPCNVTQVKTVETDGYNAVQLGFGDTITADIFNDVKFVDVIGVSKGKGTAGVMKRHHFGGQPASHGTERKHRSPGSLASRATWRGQSGKPKKGVRMAGHMGVDRVTTRNHPLVRVDKDNNLLLIKGALPGPNGGLLFVRKSVTARVKKDDAK